VSSGIAAALGALGGLAVGTFLSETIKSTVALIFRGRERRADQVPAMRNVVLRVEPAWNGSSEEYGEMTVGVLEATLTVENHSDQLIKNVRASMRRRPNGVDTARMVPAIAAKTSAQIIVKRELGLIPEDQPFEEEDTAWLDLYWFEVGFEDTYGNAWRLYYNPRDQEQTVERQTG
jgi:hypothetical protein